MRTETKFRAIMDNGYVCYFTLKDILDPHPSFAPEIKILKRWIREGHDPDKFTGIHDKEGNEIYEEDVGDLTTYHAIEGKIISRVVVKWNGDRFSFEENGKELWHVDIRSFCLNFNKLGNIYENPELLEAEK